MKQSKKAPAKSTKKRQAPLISYHKKPSSLSLETWQKALRRQFVINKPFGIEKTDHLKSPFGDYTVRNPETKNVYKVAFRGLDSPMNFCSCLDFKTNQLGTCKHLEAVIFKLQNDKKTSIDFTEYKPDYTSVYLSYQNRREVKIRIGNTFKSEYKTLAQTYFDENNTFLPEKSDCFADFLEKARAIDDHFRCYDDALEFVLELRDHAFRKQIAAKYKHADAFNDLIPIKLYPYQQEGIRFAFEAGRSLNADEMGLGKTIQAIGVSQMMRKELGIDRVLIICPTSLKYQWQSEIKKFTGENALVIEGTPPIRWEQYKQDDFYKIVSYHTVANDVSTNSFADYDMIILDEAQRIKNWKTKIAQAVKKIQTPYCMVLTGTPLENKIEELYSIVQYVNPFILGPYYRFIDYYQIKNRDGKVIGYQYLNEIGELLAETVKRRKKSEVLLQLTKRMDKNLFVPMTGQQRDLHTEFQEQVAKLVYKWKRLGFLPEKDRQRLMINLNQMRMSCNSTFLFDQKTRHDTKIDELMNILKEYFDGNHEKAVIFSQWERMTRIIAQELEANGIAYEYLHGGVPGKNRKALFDNFNNSTDCRVFLSTDAGSTGLNLQAASLIINMDIPWNPAVLEQRIARIHRMGQKNNIAVINFISLNTIEHRMLDVLKFKTSLAKGILDNGENAIFLSDSKFNTFMKDVEQMTADQAGTTNQVFVSDEEEDMEQQALAHVEKDETGKTTEKEPVILGDDDFKPLDERLPRQASLFEEQEKSDASQDVSELFKQGFSFLSGLAQTLSTREGVDRLTHALVEKDEKTGKTHLKIQVENEESVSHVLNMLGKLFKGLEK